MRFVFDTNLLIDSVQDYFNAPARLLEAVRDGECTAIVSHPIVREYNLLIQRRIQDEFQKEKLQKFINATEEVKPAHVDVVIDDEEDIKFIAAAVGGKADVLVTNDKHLLDVGEVEGVRIMTPPEAWQVFEEDSRGSSTWQEFIRGIGIGS